MGVFLSKAVATAEYPDGQSAVKAFRRRREGLVLQAEGSFILRQPEIPLG